MPKLVTPLTDIQVRNAKPKDKAYKLADGAGMYLLVNPDATKYWRFDYRLNDYTAIPAAVLTCSRISATTASLCQATLSVWP